jgi:hypothetical protein
MFIFIFVFSACNSNSDKENELLKKELELAKKELELKAKEKQLSSTNEGSIETTEPSESVYTSSSSRTTESRKSPNLVDNTQSQEKANPMKYLKLDFKFNSETYRKGLGALKIRTEKRKKYIAEGDIYNNAVYATFRNAIIEVRYLGNNRSLVGTQRLKIDKYISPKKSVSFKFDLNIPNGTRNVSGTLISVTSVN